MFETVQVALGTPAELGIRGTKNPRPTEGGPGRLPTTETTLSPGSGTRKKKTHDVASRGATLQVLSPRVQVVWHLPSTLPNWVAPRNRTDPTHWLHPGARQSILQAPLPIVVRHFRKSLRDHVGICPKRPSMLQGTCGSQTANLILPCA